MTDNKKEESLNFIIKAIENMISAKENRLQYDRTYRGKVTSKISDTSYKVQVKNVEYTVACENSLNVGQIVRVKAPLNNFSDIYVEGGSSGSSSSSGDYVTQETLKSYSTTDQMNAAITNALSGYVTTSSLNTTLNNYVKKTAFDGYVTKTSLTTTLADYATADDLADAEETLNSNISSAISTSETYTDDKLKNYSTTEAMNTAITNALSGYVTTINLNTILTDYVTAATLSNYSTTAETNTIISNALTDYATKSDLSNYPTTNDMNNAISTAITNNEASITETVTSNVKSSLAETYATKEELSNYVSTSDLDDYVKTDSKAELAAIELIGQSSTTQPYIDFHYHRATTDYTARIENSNSDGTLQFLASSSSYARINAGDTHVFGDSSPAIYFHRNNSTTATGSITNDNGQINLMASGSNHALVTTGCLEMFAGTVYIDFHHDNSSADYTSRMAEWEAGTITVNNSIVSSSDKRLKNNIEDVDEKYISVLDQLNVKTYNFNNSKHLDCGLVAQDVLKIEKENGIEESLLVRGTGKKRTLNGKEQIDYYSLNYNNLAALLLKKVQILENEIKEIKDGRTN